jgi:hypothetical protein
MPKKMLNPRTTLWVVPENGVVNPDAPTASELNAGKNISCAVVRGYTLNPTASDTDDSASICDTGNVSNRLYDNYEGELTLFRDADTDADFGLQRGFRAFQGAGRPHLGLPSSG